MNRILITGATGHLGSAVIERLLKNIPSKQISILTRNKEKRQQFLERGFDAFLGSYDDVSSLELAMEGVDTVLLISSGDQGDRMQEHKNVVDTAKIKKVKRIAYTSRSLKDRDTLVNKLMEEHFETEEYIISSGLNYTFFRNILYMESIPQFIGGAEALEQGIFLPAGEGKVAFALRSEMGEAIANVLLMEEGENRIYHFTGVDSYSFYDVAIALSELSGKEVNYTPVGSDVFAGMMKQRNVPGAAIQKMTDFITDIRNNQESMFSPDLECYLGRKPIGLKEGLKKLFSL